MLKYFLGRYKTQEMCNKVVGDFLPTLKFIPDWLVTNKMIKTLSMLYSQMMIYSLLMKILVMSHFK